MKKRLKHAYVLIISPSLRRTVRLLARTGGGEGRGVRMRVLEIETEGRGRELRGVWKASCVVWEKTALLPAVPPAVPFFPGTPLALLGVWAFSLL